MKKIIIIILMSCLLKLSAQFSPIPLTNAGNTNANIDRIGIGNWPAPFGGSPSSRFHINNFLCNQPNGPLNGLLFRSDGNQTIDNKWQMFTGTTNNNVNEKGKLFTSPNSSNGGYLIPTNNNVATNHFNIQATQGDLIFRANGNLLNGAPGTGVMNDRMRLTAVHFTEPNTAPTNIPFTRVAISSGQSPNFNLAIQDKFITNPLAMLQMGDLWVNNVGAHRSWMNYGTFISRQTDGAYFGVRQNEDPQHFDNKDKTDAIIAWGDNPNGGIGDTKYDRLRIIFNAPLSAGAPAGSAGNTNGLECMHFTPMGMPGPGASNVVYVGIGDFSINNPNSSIR